MLSGQALVFNNQNSCSRSPHVHVGKIRKNYDFAFPDFVLLFLKKKFLLGFQDRISLSIPGSPETHSADEAGLLTTKKRNKH